MPYFDRFDVAEAHYCFCCDYHGGQRCPLYARIGRITSRTGKIQLRPRPDLSADTLSENAREIYDELVRRMDAEEVDRW